DDEPDDPGRLRRPRELVVAEQVAHDGDEDPDEHRQEEDPERCPDHVPQPHLGDEHGDDLLTPSAGAVARCLPLTVHALPHQVTGGAAVGPCVAISIDRPSATY